MTTPEEYGQQLLSMNLHFSGSTAEEAKSALKECRRLESELRQMKRSINLDIKSVRAAYQQRMTNPAPVASTVLSLFGKRKIAGSLRADAKRSLRIERDRAIEPFQAIKLQIDDLLNQFGEVKIQLTEFIADDKATQLKHPPEKSRSDGKHCTSCGSRVDSSDRFCRQCGTPTGSPQATSGRNLAATTIPSWESSARNLLAQGKKIHAVKVVRESTNLGLKDAKELVESWE